MPQLFPSHHDKLIIVDIATPYEIPRSFLNLLQQRYKPWEKKDGISEHTLDCWLDKSDSSCHWEQGSFLDRKLGNNYVMYVKAWR